MIQKYTKEQAKIEVTKLVQKFKDDFHDRKNPQMKEAQLEDTYIKPLFSFLNWNIHTSGIKKGMEEFRVQTSQRVKKSTKQPDYELWLPEKENPSQMKRHLFMEAKDPKYDLQKEVQWMRQAYQYAHSTLSLSERSNKRTNLSILTDFEEFRLFDCRDPYPLTKNDASLYNKYVIKKFDLRYTDYIENFDLLWDTFERNNVQNGSLASFEITDKDLKKNRIAPDLKFLDDLKQWRLDFARSMYKSNKSVSNEHLTSATQTLINRIIFLKMLTDREIEDDYLTKILERIENDKEEISIYDSCRDIFQELDKKYNGDIFKRRDDLDPVKVENKVFKKILKSLRPEKSVYTLNAMPVEIIGNAYEQFLGDVIVHKGRGIAAEPKPEVRKAGGVYYTPKYIVDYIVENTVGEKLKKCKNPKDVSEIKIVDPACGSGSFLLGAYDILVEWHLNYFKNQVDKLFKNGKTLNQINKKYLNEVKCYSDDSEVNNFQYSLHLTSKLKKQILSNNLFGVDIDNNAVEITKFSLSMKALENTTHDELYEDYDLFNQTLLPELGSNIKCGNSLIGSDSFDGEFLFDIDERKNVNAFDWDVEFPEVFGRDKPSEGPKPSEGSRNGFDCVIGNPPYRRELDYKELMDPIARSDLGKSYRSPRMDLWYYFVHRGIEVLKKDGVLSFIVNSYWLVGTGSKKLIKQVKEETSLKEIFYFSNIRIFQNVSGRHLVFRLNKNHKSKNCKVKIINKEKETNGRPFVEGIGKVNTFYKQYEDLFIEDKIDILRTSSILKKLNKIKILTDYGIVRQGIAENPSVIGKKIAEKSNGFYLKGEGVFVLSEKELKYLKLPKNEKKIVKRYHMLDSLGRYDINDRNKKFIIYSTKSTCPSINHYPTIKKHLLKFKPIMMKRRETKKGANSWWHLHWPRDEGIWKTSKVISIQMGARPSFVFSDKEIYTTFSTNVFVPTDSKDITLQYYTAILNSKLLWYWFNHNAKKRGVGLEINGNALSRTPIKLVDFENKKDKARHDQMVAYVDTMLELNKELQKAKTEHEKEQLQRQIKATDERIDKLVYKLYNLTPEEITIVEEATK